MNKLKRKIIFNTISELFWPKDTFFIFTNALNRYVNATQKVEETEEKYQSTENIELNEQSEKTAEKCDTLRKEVMKLKPYFQQSIINAIMAWFALISLISTFCSKN